MILDNYNPFKKHTFKDKQGKIVYYDYRQKMVYYIPDDKLNKYKMFSNRWMIAITFTVLAVGFIMELKFAILCGVIIDLAMALSFRYKFLPSLVKNDNLHLDQLLPYDPRSARPESNKKILLRVFLYLLFAILLVINAYEQNLIETNAISFYLSLIVAGVSVFIAIYHLYRLIKK